MDISTKYSNICCYGWSTKPGSQGDTKQSLKGLLIVLFVTFRLLSLPFLNVKTISFKTLVFKFCLLHFGGKLSGEP